VRSPSVGPRRGTAEGSILVPPVSRHTGILGKHSESKQGMNGSEARKAETVRWLDSLAPWDVFFTGTTRYPATCRSLQKSFERFMRIDYNTISYVYTLEPHKDLSFHVHAMFDEPYAMNWKQYWRRWFDRYGRARTEPMRHKADVEAYVTKYLTKEWDVNKPEMVGDPKVNTSERQTVWWNVKMSHRQFKAA